MLRQGAGARGSRLPATAARCLRRPLPAARTDENWGLVLRGSHKQLPPKPGKWLDDWSLLLALRWKGGDSLKCVRERRAPGNPEAWIPAECGTESAPLPRPSLLRPPGPRPRRAFSPRSKLTRSRGAGCGFSSSSFASSSSFGLLSSFSSSSSSSSSFSSSSSSSSSFPTSSPSATASSFTTTTPSGATGSLQSPRPAPPLLRPPGSRTGGTDGQTDTQIPRAQLSVAADPRGPASGKLGSPPEHREGYSRI
ncbi:serine/arginine repetitive matrix protein 2-like [Ursus arctos]|uniref:serine/arginine repetitive matrix protein 2-like n=1 Tax=Ursus arctos TaxID=9644 RepID=UPI002548032D|nr:serine/arginine repetitive matrix protein 2-like [Ursus arctos]